MTFGSILLLAVIIALIVIGVKLKKNSQKLQELEELLIKE